uniref:OBG-type G domain-containing protein n=1 Tax=Biomphalaria glabrata TaxID=6526 RepID=A0A2C9M1X0_BIOGL
SPTIAFDGEKGITAKLILKLKLLSDVGIIGLPNVGKSTLLSVCSSSKTKVADYAFTTLYPELGVIFLSDYEDFVMADLPGLIEGASNGLGCGIRFLKHVERCSVLLHVLDGTSKDPLLDYYTIRKELSLYSSQILDKPEIIAISKIDEIDDFLLDEIKRKLSSSTSRKIYAFSSIIDDSILVTLEVDATRKYLMYYCILMNEGYAKTAKVFLNEANDEFGHIQKLQNRILFIERSPGYDSIDAFVGKKDIEMIIADMIFSEETAMQAYEEAIVIAEKIGDHGSVAFFEQILSDEESHLQWLRSQRDIIDSIGAAAYLQISGC